MGWPEIFNYFTGNSSGPIAKTAIGVTGIKKYGIKRESYAAKEHSRRGNLTKDDAMSNLMHNAMVENGKDSTALIAGTVLLGAAAVGGLIYGGKKMYDFFFHSTPAPLSVQASSDDHDDDEDDDDNTPGGDSNGNAFRNRTKKRPEKTVDNRDMLGHPIEKWHQASDVAPFTSIHKVD